METAGAAVETKIGIAVPYIEIELRKHLAIFNTMLL